MASQIQIWRHEYDGRDNVLKTVLIYVAAALAEIAGCYAFWGWLRLHKGWMWLLPGCASLILFACLLTLSDADEAGRAYAAYGGIYITVALFWLWKAEGIRPDRWDVAGVLLCLAGVTVILLAPHRT